MPSSRSTSRMAKPMPPILMNSRSQSRSSVRVASGTRRGRTTSALRSLIASPPPYEPAGGGTSARAGAPRRVIAVAASSLGGAPLVERTPEREHLHGHQAGHEEPD